MIKKIDHIGIAVSDMASSERKYEILTGKKSSHKEVVEEQKVETSFFPVGDVRLELLKGIHPESPIAKFIARKGEGIHHICFEVEDLKQSKAFFTKCGFTFIEGISETGAGGSKVAFLHPKGTGGILMELVEYPEK